MDITNGLYILGILAGLVAASEWLSQNTRFRHLGTALLVILLTAILANVGILPAGSSAERPVPIYEGIFAYVAPISIFWLLLGVSLRDILQAGLPLIILFCLGALGTAIGITAGMWLVDAPSTIGPKFAPLGGMFVGTYTGGSVNFNAVALEYDMMKEGVLFSGSIAADNIITALWMIVTLALPSLLRPFWPKNTKKLPTAQAIEATSNPDMEELNPMDLAITLLLGTLSWWVSEWLASQLGTMGLYVPAILILTVIALALAQIPRIQKLAGPKVLGMFSVYIFLAVIGAFCDIQALAQLGRLGLVILGFATVGVLIHGLVIIAAARIMRLDPILAAVASQANVGGGTSALALARSLGRSDLVLPAVLLGSLGNALGTFLGFWVAQQILPLL